MTAAYFNSMRRGAYACLSYVNTFWITIILLCFGVLVARQYPSPFYGASTSDWWVYEPDGQTIIDKPAAIQAQLGRVLPVGRTICLSRQVYVHIYKELDGTGGHTWPLQDPGGGDRVLRAGCQMRISPSTLPAAGPAAPKPGDYILNVYFIVQRNPFVDLISNGPLIVRLHPVPVEVLR